MYQITKTNQITKDREVIDFDHSEFEMNTEIEELHSMEFCRIRYNSDTITPIVLNEKGLSFCTSSREGHFIYQVEQFDEMFEMLSDIFKPINQN